MGGAKEVRTEVIEGDFGAGCYVDVVIKVKRSNSGILSGLHYTLATA